MNCSVIFIVFVAFISFANAAPQSEPEGEQIGILAVSYRLFRTPKTWFEAGEYCRKTNGDLIAPWSVEIDRKLRDIISSNDLGTTPVWTDGQYDASASPLGWYWATNEWEFDYKAWFSGQPGYSCRNECTTASGTQSNYGWRHQRCDTPLFFVCVYQV